MGAWKKMLQNENKDFVRGLIAGIETYAVWDNGTQSVGILRKPLKQVIADIKEDLTEDQKPEGSWYHGS